MTMTFYVLKYIPSPMEIMDCNLTGDGFLADVEFLHQLTKDGIKGTSERNLLWISDDTGPYALPLHWFIPI